LSFHELPKSAPPEIHAYYESAAKDTIELLGCRLSFVDPFFGELDAL
jgi:hypothetical protein